MFVTKSVDDRVMLKIDVNAAAKNVLKRFSSHTMSARECKHHGLEVFTSKHLYNAMKIRTAWKFFQDRKQQRKEGVEDQVDFAPVGEEHNREETPGSQGEVMEIGERKTVMSQSYG